MNENDELEIELDNPNEEIEILEENYVYINIPESVIEELQQEIQARALITETGAQLTLEINSSTYVLIAKLKDKNGNLIYTSNGIDLPLESMIVNGTYNETTKKLILTLQNGNTIEISLSDLISGLVSETQLAEALTNYYNKGQTNTLLNAKANSTDVYQKTDVYNKEETNTLLSAKQSQIDEVNAKLNLKQDKIDNTLETINKIIPNSINEVYKRIERLYNLLPTEHEIGEYIKITDGIDLPLKYFNINGKSIQKTRTGKNLWKMPSTETKNGVTLTVYNDGIFNLKGTATENTSFKVEEPDYVDFTQGYNYVLSTNHTGVQYQVALYNNDTWVSTPLNRMANESVNEKTAHPTVTQEYNQTRCIITIPAETTVNITNGYVQLEKGPSATEYEQYGVSPSTEYPSEIQSSGDSGNLIIEKRNENQLKLKDKVSTAPSGLTEFKIEDQTITIKGTTTSQAMLYLGFDNFKLKAGTYTLVAFLTNEVGANTSQLILGKVLSGSSAVYRAVTLNLWGGTTRLKSFTLDEDSTIVGGQSWFYSNNRVTYDEEIKLLLLKGEYSIETLPEYVKAQSKSYTLSIQQPMRSLSDVKDDFKNENMMLYENHKIGYDIYDGSNDEDWKYFNSIVYIDNPKIKKIENVQFNLNFLTNYFKPAQNKCYIAHTTGQRLHIKLSTVGLSNITNLAQWRQWLAEHNLKFQYELTEPVLLPFTDTQMSQFDIILNADLYESETHYFCNDNITPILDIVYYKKDNNN